MLRFNKKIISLSIIITMMCSLMNISIHGADDGIIEKSTPDLVKAAGDNQVQSYNGLEEYINLLTVLGITPRMYPEDFSVDVKRHEMARYIVGLLKTENIIGDSVLEVFQDVNVTDSYYTNVMTLYMMGIVSGDSEGKFKPDDFISYNEAVKMIITALGYEPLAAQLGGYPDGYFAAAQRIGLLTGLSVSGNGGVSKNLAVRLLVNAINSDFLQIGVSAGNLVFNESDNQSYLRMVFNVERYSGVVTGARELWLREDSGSLTDTVEIDNELYEYASQDVAEGKELIGRTVYYYLHFQGNSSNNRHSKIILIGAQEDMNSVLHVESKFILAGNTVQSFSYNTEDGKTRTVKISKDAIVIYNGKRSLNIEDSDFSPKNGEVTLIDNNNDRLYDYAMITEYKLYLAQSSVFDIVSLKYGEQDNNGIISGMSMNLKDRDDVVFFHGDTVVTNDSVFEWDVLKFKVDKTGTSAGIDIIRNQVGGTITSLGYAEGEDYVEISGKTYNISQLYKDTLLAGHPETIELFLGLTVTLVLDDMDRVVGIRSNFSAEKLYGYLMEIDTENGFGDNFKLRILGEFRDVQVYTTADNLMINDIRPKNASDVLKAFNGTDDRFLPQLIKYKTNTNGKITEIDTAQRPTNFPGYNREKFSLDDTSFRTNYVIPQVGNVPFFYIPADRNDISQYMSYQAHDILYMFNQNADFEIFDTVRYTEEHDIRKISAIVMYGRPGNVVYDIYGISGVAFGREIDNNQTDNKQNFRGKVIVTRVNPALTESGETALKLTGIGISKDSRDLEFTAYFDDVVHNVDPNGTYGPGGDLKPEDLKPGDIIGIGYKNPYARELRINRFGVLGRVDEYTDPAVNKLYMMNQDQTSVVGDLSNYNMWHTNFIGEVIFTTGNDFVVSTKNKQGDAAYFGMWKSNDETFVYAYDAKNKKIYKSDTNQIQKGGRGMFFSEHGMRLGFAMLVIE